MELNLSETGVFPSAKIHGALINYKFMRLCHKIKYIICTWNDGSGVGSNDSRHILWIANASTSHGRDGGGIDSAGYQTISGNAEARGKP